MTVSSATDTNKQYQIENEDVIYELSHKNSKFDADEKRRLRHSKLSKGGRSHTNYEPEVPAVLAKRSSMQNSARFDTSEHYERTDDKLPQPVAHMDFKNLQPSEHDSSVVHFNALSNTLGRDRGESMAALEAYMSQEKLSFVVEQTPELELNLQ